MEIKLKLKRHESFSIREGWLAKGIKNVKEVLKMMYEQDHLLYLENLEPEGTKITIWIPKTLKCTDEEKDEER